MKTTFILISLLFAFSFSWSQLTEKDMKDLGFKKIEIRDLENNTIKLIADDWGLVTAGTKDSFNTMTISWGGIGNLWNKPSTFIFIKPERYTYGFIEETQSYTISFFDHGKYKEDLIICGTKSGRDGDKLKETKLNAIELPSGEMAFEEAQIIIDCKIIYQDSLDPKYTPEKEKEVYYKTENFHKMYVGEIMSVWIKK